MNEPQQRKNDLALLGFPDYREPAIRLAEAADIPYYDIGVHRFPDGESRIQLPEALPENVVICRTLDHPNAKLVELLLAANTARRLGARRLALVAPYLCYMRQDKAFHPGEAVSQKIIGELLADYFDSLITVDPHLHRVHSLNEVVPDTACITLTATEPMASFLAVTVDKPLLLGPDEESVQWVANLAGHHGYDYGVAKKTRTGDYSVDVKLPAMDFDGRNIVLVDDIASSGQTLVNAAQKLKDQHPASISVLVTHALFGDDADKSLHEAGVQSIYSTDSVLHASNRIELSGLLVPTLGRIYKGNVKK